ncbi:hypothetical protein [Streptomyces sp. MST-110588]|uniref:hypothetical protein n=1 Tax=Streptomyces sp. MST-110588 TaxID=2833628 RepID=UPI001F5D7A7C|nr:hypothetical protein [Streptomyces sp. MST-110588]UNO38462.1 hypothetical protein KGS77_00855 [Streptomyces sp. MST-110588]
MRVRVSAARRSVFRAVAAALLALLSVLGTTHNAEPALSAPAVSIAADDAAATGPETDESGGVLPGQHRVAGAARVGRAARRPAGHSRMADFSASPADAVRRPPLRPPSSAPERALVTATCSRHTVLRC